MFWQERSANDNCLSNPNLWVRDSCSLLWEQITTEVKIKVWSVCLVSLSLKGWRWKWKSWLLFESRYGIWILVSYFSTLPGGCPVSHSVTIHYDYQSTSKLEVGVKTSCISSVLSVSAGWSEGWIWFVLLCWVIREKIALPGLRNTARQRLWWFISRRGSML